MKDEQVDVVKCQPSFGDRVHGRLAQRVHRADERGVPVHPDPPLVVRGDDRTRAGAIGRQPDPPDPAGGVGPRRSQDDRAGAVSEERGGATIVGIGQS